MANARRLKRVRVRTPSVLASAIFLALAMLAVEPAAAQSSFHRYSVAYETSFPGAFTGVSVVRDDVGLHTQGNGCFMPFSGTPVYQTQWVILPSTGGGQNWMEIGTGHQCSDLFRYWFWGYGFDGLWYPVGTQSGIGPGTHRFQVYRHSGNQWDWYIDASHMAGPLSWTNIGNQVRAGLESYDGFAVVSNHTYRELQMTVNQSPWTNWAGMDFSDVTSAPMCGGWNNATQWRASENSPC